VALIDAQLTVNPQCTQLFLVGGFSQPPYLIKRVTEAFSARVPKIVTPPDSGEHLGTNVTQKTCSWLVHLPVSVICGLKIGLFETFEDAFPFCNVKRSCSYSRFLEHPTDWLTKNPDSKGGCSAARRLSI
jgi:hypothetical protein